MAVGISNFQTLYQTYYPDSELPYLIPSSAVLLNMFLNGSTIPNVSGDVVDMPWLAGPPTGTSQTYSIAAGLAGNAPKALRPQVRVSQLYKNISILDKDNLLSKGEAAYGELMEVTVKGARMDFLNKLDMLLHLNGSGNRAAFTWASATPKVLTFVNAVTQLTGDTNGAALGGPVGQTVFEVGDQVVVTSTNPSDGSIPTVVAGPYNVVSVDGNANSITLDQDPTAFLTNTNTYAVALAGDNLGFSSALLNPAIIGVAAYNPYGGVSTTDSFLGVNRSQFGTRYSGTYFNATTGFSIEQGLRKAATGMKNTGIESSGVTVCLHPDDYDTLDFKMSAQNRYATHEIGVAFFDSLRINSTMGSMNMVVDVHQAKGQARLYAPNAMELMYHDSLPHFASLRGGEEEAFGRNYDGRELRLRAYVQTRTRDPRRLAVVALPTI